jgi:hypothetical protein
MTVNRDTSCPRAPGIVRETPGPSWWASLRYLDRYRNEGTRTYSRHAAYTEAEERYQPNSAVESFDLPVVELPAERMRVYLADPTPELAARYLYDDTVAFCIHPQVLEACAEEAYVRRSHDLGTPRPPVRVSPTSSTRTLAVQAEGPPHALKVHFPFRVSRYERRMREEVVQQAIQVSREIERHIDELDADFAFLREVIGITHENLEPDSPRGGNWGYLVREVTPYPRPRADIRLVPGFALYGADRFEPGERPLLLELIADDDRVDSVLEAILFPVIRHWIRLFLTLGLILEPHGQNALLEVDGRGRIVRIVHRDLSLGVDMRRRRDLSLSSAGLNGYNRMETGDFASIAYDKFMGGHFFQRIVETLERDDPSVRPEAIHGACREEFCRLFPGHREYLPGTVWYFSEDRDEFGKPRFIDTGEAPVWRP